MHTLKRHGSLPMLFSVIFFVKATTGRGGFLAVRCAAMLVIATIGCTPEGVVSARDGWLCRIGFERDWLSSTSLDGFEPVEMPVNLKADEVIIRSMEEEGHRRITLRRELPDPVAEKLAEGQPMAMVNAIFRPGGIVYFNERELLRFDVDNLPHNLEPVSTLSPTDYRRDGPNAVFIVLDANDEAAGWIVRSARMRFAEPAKLSRSIGFQVMIACLLAGAYILLGIYYLSVSLFRSRASLQHYFAAGLFLIYATFTVGETPVKDLIFSQDLAYLRYVLDCMCVTMLGPFLVLFATCFLGRKPPLILWIWLAYSVVDLVIWSIFPTFPGLLVWGVAFVFVGTPYSGYMIVSEMRKGNRDAFYIAAGVALIVLGAVYDGVRVLFLNQSTVLIPYSLSLVAFASAGLLARRFVETYREVEKLNVDLEGRVEERTRELREAQQALLESAHKSGLADMAAGVLHNIGNIMVSAFTATSSAREGLGKSKLDSLDQANNILTDEESSIGQILSSEPKGKELAKYYHLVAQVLRREQKNFAEDLDKITESLELMKAAVDSQREYANTKQLLQVVSVKKVTSEAIEVTRAILDEEGVQVVVDVEDVAVKAQQYKLVHVLVNLLKNAIEAMAETPRSQRVVRIQAHQEAESVMITVTDAGEGIAQSEFNKIFGQGSSSRGKGRGFGLHTCANAISEMKGNISVASEGLGHGASFTVSLAASRPTSETT